MAEHTRVAIVDDHPFMREGLKDLLTLDPDFELIGEASSPAEARATLERAKPDIAVVDLSLPSSEDGMELVRWIRKNHPQVRVLVLSMLDEALYAERLLRLGVNGYVMKNTASADLLMALRKVAKGQRHLSPDMSERMVNLLRAPRRAEAMGADPVSGLTDREVEVFRLLGKGVATRDIAKQLVLSMKTVDAHRRHIREKLGLLSTNELIRYATQWVTDSAGTSH